MVFVGAKVVSDGANMVQHQSGPPILACRKASLSAHFSDKPTLHGQAAAGITSEWPTIRELV